MTYGKSNGYVTNDVTMTQKVQVVTQIRLKPNMSKQLEMLFSNKIANY